MNSAMHLGPLKDDLLSYIPTFSRPAARTSEQNRDAKGTQRQMDD
jgi:hypothetical protein